MVEIEIEKLVIDPCNIRGQCWQLDKKDFEMTENVKEEGLYNACIVRPLTDGKFGVVCGGRRFNSCIDAGKKTVKCEIREMSDTEARMTSWVENYHIRKVDAAGHVLGMKKIIEDLSKQGYPQIDILQIIKRKTGLGLDEIERYINAAKLPNEIIELMKEPNERSPETQAILKQRGLEKYAHSKLELHKASDIGLEFGTYSLDKLFDIASYACSVSRKNFKGFIGKVKSLKKITAADLEGLFSIGKGDLIELSLDNRMLPALDIACQKENLKRIELCVKALEEYLIRSGYL